MSKKSIWIKGLEIRKMTNKQIANYEFNARITNPDEPSDHELLKQLALNQASDHELLLMLVKEVKDIKLKLKEHDQLFRDHGWIK